MPNKKFSARLFAAVTSSDDPGDVVSAISEVEPCPDKDTALFVMTRAIEDTCGLEFLLSAVSLKSFNVLVDALASDFPTSAQEYIDSPLPVRCLQKIATTLFSLEYPDPLEARKVEAFRLAVERNPAVLEELASLFPEVSARTARKRKLRATVIRETLDVSRFISIGRGPPRTVREAADLAEELLVEQLDVLKAFSRMIRTSEVAAQVRSRFRDFGDSTGTFPSRIGTTEPDYGLESLQVNLVYSNPADFGRWAIITTDLMRTSLLEFSEAGPDALDPVQEKLRELSHGIFSPGNHERIPVKGPIDIYEAEIVRRKQRLVYQIDCVALNKYDIPTQATLVFGFFDEEERRKISWDEVSRQQGRRGREYCDACKVRLPEDRPHVFSPGVFPKLDLDPIPSAQRQSTVSRRLPKSSVESVHTLLVLGKHALFSQSYLNALRNGVKVSPVYRLSPLELEAINYSGSMILHGRSGTGKTTVTIFKIFGIEREWAERAQEYPTRPRQMFVSKSALLVQKVEREYRQLVQLDAQADNAPEHFGSQADRVQHLDDDVLLAENFGGWRKHIPKRFSELKNEHFPLFVTSHELYTMLEHDLFPRLDPELQSRNTGTMLSAYYHKSTATKYVTFDLFKAHYWPRLSHKLRETTSPAVVFSEFLGVIKGSEASIDNTMAALDRETYEKRRVQNIDYAEFERYMKLKKARSERDAADRTYALLHALKTELFPGKKAHFLYVDEVQDYLTTDVILLRQMCQNPQGVFLAGDIAQHIEPGCSFRFEDQATALFQYEKAVYKRDPKKMPCFQLSVNYRSPGGVVNCAHSVVELLQLFPHAIDDLEREVGIIDGLKPLMIHRSSESDVFETFFLLDADGRPTIMLGANQCILVRDDAARARLKAKLGNIGVILNLHQCKGLEFDDVLLYDFFGSSLVDEDLWWDLYAKDTGRTKGEKPLYSMMFEQDDQYHAPLVTELKFLYVAITRTRKNLWIVDKSMRCEPMKKYWLDEHLVEIADDNMSLSRFAVRSARRDWTIVATRLLQQEQFEEAASAFDRAGDDRMSRMAMALGLKRLAELAPQKASLEAFKAAATALVQSALDASHSLVQQRRLFSSAGACYVYLDDHKRAADAFSRAEEWTAAAAHYFDANLLDNAVRIVDLAKQRGDEVRQDVQARIVDTAKNSYCDQGRVPDARKLFASDEVFKDFLIAQHFPIAHAEFLEQRQETKAAARLFYEEGAVLKAIQLLSEHLDDTEACDLAWNFALSHLWACFSVGSLHALERESERTRLIELLSQLEKLPQTSLSSLQRQTLESFEAIAFRNVQKLKRLADSFHHSGRAEERLLCLDHSFSNPWLIDTADQQAFIDYVEQFYAYASLLNDIVQKPQLSEDFRRLLGLKVIELDEENVGLHEGTSVARTYRDMKGFNAPLQRIPKDSIFPLIRTFLSVHLKHAIDRQVRFVENRGSVLDACINLSLTGKCNKSHTKPFSHQLDRAWYNRRVWFHVLEIRILHIAHRLPHSESFGKRANQKREWLARLENALNPLFYLHGSQSLLRVTDIKDTSGAFAVIKHWTIEVLYNLDPSRSDLQEAFLTNFLNAVKLGLRLERATPGTQAVERHIASSPTLTRCRHPGLWEETSDGSRGAYTLDFLRNVLLASGDVTDGVRFLDFLSKQRVPVDFVALCDLVDRLTGLCILVWTCAMSGSLHNVILPRSWVFELWPDSARLTGTNPTHLRQLVQALERILNDVYQGRISIASLKHRVSDLKPDAARDACMNRILRDLCLLGLRFPDDNLRQHIVSVITKLWTSSKVHGFIPLSRRYLSAESWERLEHAVLNSCQYSCADEMVHLVQAAAPPSRPIRSKVVRYITFTKQEEIPSLVRFEDNPFLPNTAAAEAGPDGIALAEHPSLPLKSSESPGDENMSHEEDDVEQARSDVAARRIQRAWRAHRVPKLASDAERYRLIKACRRRAANTEWAQTREHFRLAFVLHLPRLLFCVDWLVAHIAQIKADLVRMRQLADTMEKGAFSAQLSGVARFEMQAKMLQATLSPTAEVHNGTNALYVLRNSARSVGKLVDTIASAHGKLDPIERDLALALRGLKYTGKWPRVPKTLGAD